MVHFWTLVRPAPRLCWSLHPCFDQLAVLRLRRPLGRVLIDAHPEDIHMVDFVRPHGEKVMRTIADYRQLNDALFHAGFNSGSQYEWEDTPNRLHFYIVDRTTDDR